jgi:hypothetical protein
MLAKRGGLAVQRKYRILAGSQNEFIAVADLKLQILRLALQGADDITVAPVLRAVVSHC